MIDPVAKLVTSVLFHGLSIFMRIGSKEANGECLENTDERGLRQLSLVLQVREDLRHGYVPRRAAGHGLLGDAHGSGCNALRVTSSCLVLTRIPVLV